MVNPQQASIELHEILDFLKTNLKLREIYQKILYQKLITQAAEVRNLIVTDEEIQAEADRQRHEMRLEKAADTLAWLEEQMITPDDWETGIRANLLRQKLADSLFSNNVDKVFAQNRLDFEQVVLYQIIVPYEQLAWEIFYQIEEEEMSFYQAAHLYDIDEKRRYYCGYEGKLYRRLINPDLATAIFVAQPGEVISPIKIENQYHILLVEEFISAELTSDLYQEILNKMFEEWLASELNHLLHNIDTQNS